MYDGNQVLKFQNKFKAKDLGGLSVELTERKGTGNYDKERTQFNTHYVSLREPTLASQVYSTLNNNGVYYNNGKNVNLINGVIITSGQEFFQSLGMNFKETDRVHQLGKKKGQKVLVPDIKDKSDIPDKVKLFFDDSYSFLAEFVGKENIVYAEVHYDEDTPHMHFYFLPVVDKVKRKVFETDNNGNILKKEITGKDGITKLVPIQKKDENGKNVYKDEEGKFLNSDYFWKNKGGKASFAKVQDDYNKFITERGFNLFRGNIGDNVYHKTKAQKEIDDLQEQIQDMKIELEKNKKLNDIEKEVSQKIKELDESDILKPYKKPLGKYKTSDVDKLIKYSKSIQIENYDNEAIIKEQKIIIKDMSNKLKQISDENNNLRTGKAIKQRDETISKLKTTISSQKEIIKEKNNIIDSLEKNLNTLNEKFNNFKEKIYDLWEKLGKAFYHLLGNHYATERDLSYESLKSRARVVNNKYEKDKSDDFDLSL